MGKANLTRALSSFRRNCSTPQRTSFAGIGYWRGDVNGSGRVAQVVYAPLAVEWPTQAGLRCLAALVLCWR
jgi:hypothetical protein